MHTVIPRRIEEIDTPALLVDLNRMEKNLETMQARTDAWEGRLRPHIKTYRTQEIFLNRMSDEHASFDIPEENSLSFAIGDRLEIIPNHACPTTNLYDCVYGIRKGFVEVRWPILCRGKSQ